MTPEEFLAAVGAVERAEPTLGGIGAWMVAAAAAGIAADSRSFARELGVGHALALRALAAMAGPCAPLEETGRDARTQRARYRLTARGAALAWTAGIRAALEAA